MTLKQAAKGAFSWTKQHLVEVLNLLALMGVLLTIFYAHRQLADARRTAEAMSLFALKADLGQSQRRYYDSLTAYGTPDSNRYWDVTMSTVGYLITIEYACRLYLDDLLGDEAERFLEVVIEDDLKFLGPFNEDGRLVLDSDEGVSVPWVDPANPETHNDLYPRTLECAEHLGVSIGTD